MVKVSMFNGDEIFGTRNKDGSWDLEITGIESNSDGSSQELKLTIKGASIEVEMSTHEPPNVKVMTDDTIHVVERPIFH